MIEKIKAIPKTIQSSKNIHIMLLIAFPLLYFINYLFSFLMRSIFQVSNENEIVKKLYFYNGEPNHENVFIISFLITVFYSLIYIYKLHNFDYSKISITKISINIFFFICSLSFLAFEIYEKLKHEHVDISKITFNNIKIFVILIFSLLIIECMTNKVKANINININKTILRSYFLFSSLIYFTFILYLMFNGITAKVLLSSYITWTSLFCISLFFIFQYCFIFEVKIDGINGPFEKVFRFIIFWCLCLFIATCVEYKNNIFNFDNWNKINRYGIFLFFFIGAVFAYLFEKYIMRINTTAEYSIAICFALLIPNTNLNIFFLFPIVFIEILKRGTDGEPYLRYFNLFLLLFLFNYAIQHGGHFTHDYLTGNNKSTSINILN